MPIKLNNLSAMFAQQKTQTHKNKLSESLNKLSSGLRINSAKDDAAGLSVSEAMRSQIRSSSVAERNTFDGLSLAQTADGALGEVGDVLGRMRELAMQSSNGALNDEQRGMIDTEFGQLQSELTRLQEGSEYNGISVIGSDADSVTVQAGPDDSVADQIALPVGGVSLSTVVSGSTGVSSLGGAQAALGRIDEALSNVSSSRSSLGASMNRLDTAANQIQESRQNLVEAESRIRDADVAAEASNMVKEKLLTQMGLAVQGQANQLPQGAFSLLG